MKAQEILNEYLKSHPDFWEFEEEINEIKRLKTLVELENMNKIDIDRKDLYEFDKPTERTRKRLIELDKIGMTEVDAAQFGVKNIMSGLYIEMVWHYNDQQWDDYIQWAKDLIKNRS